MAFRHPGEDDEWQRRRDAQRRHIAWIQDRITLSVFHKRPAHEITKLMEELRAATRKDN
jgi:hypothetical protein